MHVMSKVDFFVFAFLFLVSFSAFSLLAFLSSLSAFSFSAAFAAFALLVRLPAFSFSAAFAAALLAAFVCLAFAFRNERRTSALDAC